MQHLNPSDHQVDTVQGLVDALSAALRQPVLLDDPAFRTIAYSRQWGAIDAVRRETILTREPTPEVRRALLEQIAADGADVIRTRPDETLGMSARICVPVRDRATTLAYIWLLDPDGEVVDEDLERVTATARRAAEVLAGHHPARRPDHTELISSMTSPDTAERERAMHVVNAHHLLPGRELVTCLIAPVDRGTDVVALAWDLCHRLLAGRALTGGTPEGAALTFSAGGTAPIALRPEEVAPWVSMALGPAVAVGQSGLFTSLAAFGDSVRQARAALRVARATGAPRPYAAWPELRADRVVAQLPPSLADDLPEALVQLVREDAVLTGTLATYLDAAGDIKETAARLHLHRSGVYYRLCRIAEITGLDLQRGDDRLLAHLAVRLVALG